jgi:hypothetical protein
LLRSLPEVAIVDTNPQAPGILPAPPGGAGDVPAPVHPLVRTLGAGWTGWIAGAGLLGTLALACGDRGPWALVLLPLVLLAGFLAARTAAEWPRVGFPVCILGVGTFVVSAGLFKAGVNWAREWETLRNTGALGVSPGAHALLGMGLSVLLGGSLLGVLFLHGGAVWKALSSIRMAVTTLASIGILSVIGTMVVQRFGAGSLPESEKEFVEKFIKGQGAVPVNARFMLFPPDLSLTPEERERADLMGKAFGEGKGRQALLHSEGLKERTVKAKAIEDHVASRREHLLRLFERLDGLGFTGVFRTWWFNALLVLLSVQVIAVIAKRYPWGGWYGTGWVMTHVGVLVILAGCVISDGFLKDGSLGLVPGESAEQFEEYTRLDARGKPTRSDLGYRVLMLGTDQTFYHELQIAFPEVHAGNDVLWTQEQLRPGRVIKGIRDPGKPGVSYDLRIVDAWERARVQSEMVSAKSRGLPGGKPLAKVRFLHVEDHDGSSEHVVDEGYLSPEGWYTGRYPSYAVRYLRAATEAEARDLLEGKDLATAGKHGALVVRVPGAGAPALLPAEPGATAVVEAGEGVRWTVEIQQFHPRYLLKGGERPAEHGAPEGDWSGNPVLAIRVRREGGPAGAPAEGTTVVYGEPSLQEQWESILRRGGGGGDGHDHGAGAKAGPAAEIAARFDYLPEVHGRIVEGPGVPRTLAILRRGAAPEHREFTKQGATALLGTEGLALRFEEVLEDAVPDTVVQPLHQETDEEYLASCLRTLETGVRPPETVSVARIEVTERDGKGGEKVRAETLVAGKPGVARDRAFVSTDGRLFIGMAETRNSLMFRSALEVQSLAGQTLQEDGKPVRTVVRVNHPLQWGGYAFYQNNFIPRGRDPMGRETAEASIFRVKYDRGIPTIYTGFAILTLGVCIMLYLNPVVRRRKAAAEGTPSREA